MKNLYSALRASLVLLVLLSLLLGVIYPLIIMGFSQVLFEHRAAGSLIERGGKVIGSRLLGQSFTSPQYFWGRLSATTPAYNAAASAGSNFSPANPRLLAAASERIGELQKADPANKERIPVDLVTASASGVDPHISPAAATYQVSRVAAARHMKESDVQALVDKNTEGRLLGFIDEARVNVLMLNLALDEAHVPAVSK